MRSIQSFIDKPYVWIGALVLLIIIILVITYLKCQKTNEKEGFSTYPVNNARIGLGDSASRYYNDYADTQDIEKVPIIPRGEDGDPILGGLLNTPNYEGDSNSLNLADINYNDPSPYRTPPEISSLLGRIKMCESVKTWDCEALDNPEFGKYCGICTGPGQDHLGTATDKSGMYLDPERKQMVFDEAKAKGEKPVWLPTTGICKGEFILQRPYCDVQRDRWHCSTMRSFDDNNGKTKCAMCVQGAPNTYVYMGARAGKEEGYKLRANPQKFPIRLRFAVSQKDNCYIRLARSSDMKEYAGGFVPNTNVYIVDIPEAMENEQYSLLIRYPEYGDYRYSEEEIKRFWAQVKPPVAPLVRAMYGPNINDPTADDDRAVDVTNYIKSKFPKMATCAKVDVNVSNDGLGGDPAPGIHKQLRLSYSENGTDFAYAYGHEFGQSRPVMTAGAFNALCPPPANPLDAEKAICETNENGQPNGRIFTKGANGNYYGTTVKNGPWCIQDAPRMNRGIIGLWESRGVAPRTVPLNPSIDRINGFNVGEDGPPLYGTAMSSKEFKKIVPPSARPGIPDYLFWTWARKGKMAMCEFLLSVPATLRDPTIIDDMQLCPIGPLVSTPKGSERMQAGPCEKLINGQPQGPGTYTDACISETFLSSGCSRKGTVYPNTPDKIKALSTDADTNERLNIDGILEKANEIYTIATTSMTSDGLKVEQDTYAAKNMECFGQLITNPCDTAFKAAGPHPIACLDFLFRNAGKDNPVIGQTYPGMYNRSSGTDRTPKVPVMYCQRGGSMSPVTADGKQNDEAIAAANSYGSVANVREFYRQIHYDANFNTNMTEQKIALDQCYGVGVKSKAPVCKGTKARYVMVRPTLDFGDNWIQIAQLQVFDVYDQNVAFKKKCKSSSLWGGSSNEAPVDGKSGPRPFPQIYHAGSNDANNTWWMVDLGATFEIAYIVYYNRADCCQFRSRGMRIQMLDENRAVIKERKLNGGDTETVMFSNMKPTGLLKVGSTIMFVPGKYPGSAIQLQPGNEVLVTPTKPNTRESAWLVVPANNGLSGFSFKHKFSEVFLRMQGFKVRASPDDGTATFKNESTFKVGDSVSGLPGQVSYESLATPNSYMSVLETMGVFVQPATNPKDQKMASFYVKMSSA